MLNPSPKEVYDALVIGAGIQGAGIAQALALNGLRVAVLERNAQAGLETSSASSKLIHGGLRYLETLQIPLVYECLRERKRLLANAPELARLARFYIPIYRTSSRPAWWVGAGLALYALLGGLAQANRFRVLPKREWAELGVNTHELKAVLQYFDAQTHDRELTAAVLASAGALGAQIHFNAAAQTLAFEHDTFVVSTATQTLRSRTLVNAAGPWVNQVAGLMSELPKPPIDWVQGVHLVLPRAVPAGCFYVESPRDGRPMFVLPWQGAALVGTTERILAEPKAAASAAEIQYLLDGFNHYFPALACRAEEVVEVMAGIRVLPASPRDANARSRDTQITEWRKAGALYLGVYGGKLTSYRAVAETVSRTLTECLGVSKHGFKTTRNLPFGGASGRS